jgi:CubicO group peptidase (beta-lactamase class C family)
MTPRPGSLAEALALADGFGASQVALGVTDADGTLATHGDQAFRPRIASVTKLITALAVWVAVEEGSVGWDEPAGPDGATVRHLISHASGLPFDGDTPIARPGTRRIYSNPGYRLLAAHVAERTGVDWGDYVQEAVLDPLGMADTAYGDRDPSKDAVSTVPDLLRLARELLRPTLVSAETHHLATVQVAFPGLAGVLPDVGSFDPNDWGLGPEQRDHKHPHWTGTIAGPRLFGHFGGSGTFLWVEPDRGLALTYLGNKEWGPWSLEAFAQLSDAVLSAPSTPA